MSDPVRHLSAYAVDQLAASLMPEPQRRVAQTHLAGCERCREALTAASALHARFADRFLERSLPELVERASRRWRLTWALPFALVPAVGLALLTLVILPQRNVGPDLMTKGDHPALRVVGERDGAVFVVHDGQALREGDRVRFSFDVPDEGYVLVASVDGAGKVSVYVPFDGSASLPLSGDGPFVSPDVVRLDAAPGPERVFALFTRAPLSASSARDALSTLGRRGPAAIRDARSLPLDVDQQLSFLWEKSAP